MCACELYVRIRGEVPGRENFFKILFELKLLQQGSIQHDHHHHHHVRVHITYMRNEEIFIFIHVVEFLVKHIFLYTYAMNITQKVNENASKPV